MIFPIGLDAKVDTLHCEDALSRTVDDIWINNLKHVISNENNLS